jgi:hypothetical protein
LYDYSHLIIISHPFTYKNLSLLLNPDAPLTSRTQKMGCTETKTSEEKMKMIRITGINKLGRKSQPGSEGRNWPCRMPASLAINS